jgi:hypothetical protein
MGSKNKVRKNVKDGKLKNIDEILNSDKKILEEQIVDKLLDVQVDLISIGQSKGNLVVKKEELGDKLKEKLERVMFLHFLQWLLLETKKDI